MDIVCIYDPERSGKFPIIRVASDDHLSTEGIEPYAEEAAIFAEEYGLPVHIQNVLGYTHLIMFPEGWGG